MTFMGHLLTSKSSFSLPRSNRLVCVVAVWQLLLVGRQEDGRHRPPQPALLPRLRPGQRGRAAPGRLPLHVLVGPEERAVPGAHHGRGHHGALDGHVARQQEEEVTRCARRRRRRRGCGDARAQTIVTEEGGVRKEGLALSVTDNAIFCPPREANRRMGGQ